MKLANSKILVDNRYVSTVHWNLASAFIGLLNVTFSRFDTPLDFLESTNEQANGLARNCPYGHSAARAQAATPPVNSLVKVPYVFFDRPDSTLTYPAPTGNPSLGTGAANILDQFPASSTTGSNRHDALLSNDGGATAQTFGIDDSYTFSAIINLSDTNNSPRKEAGLRINSPQTGDALFIINSDAGEIVAFGGGAPFYLFGNNAGSNGYTPGTSILMGFTIVGGGDGVGGIRA